MEIPLAAEILAATVGRNTQNSRALADLSLFLAVVKEHRESAIEVTK